MATLITGGTGFIGSHLARYLIQQKGDSGIVMFDKYPAYDLIADIRDQVNIVQGDILEPTELLQAMHQYAVDRVFHLAYTIGGDVTANPTRAINVNCIGTTNVFEAARLHGAKRVVFTSAAGVYSNRKNLTGLADFNEDVMPRPATLYGACKLFNELEAEIYWNTYGLDVIGLRPFSVIGPGRVLRVSRHDLRNFWADAPGLAALGNPVIMPPNEQVVVWIYVVDAAQALYRAMTVENPVHRIFNMHSGRLLIGECTTQLRKLLPDAQITIDTEPAEALQLTSNERLRTELGFQPQYTIKRALEEYLQMVRTGAGLA